MAPSSSDTRNSGVRPPRSAVTISALPSAVHRTPCGQPSQPAVRTRTGPPASGTTATSCVGGSVGVVRPSRRRATVRPSGEIRGSPNRWSSSSASVRTAPVATSTATTVDRTSPPGSGTSHAVTTVEPSGLRSGAAWSSARPTWPVRSRRVQASSPASSGGDATNSRFAAAPRSWSQNRIGVLSCRIAATLASLRSVTAAASSSSSVEPGRAGATTTTVPDPDATAKPLTPPGRVTTGRASPPAPGSSHSDDGSSSLSASGTGRAETNSRSPSGVKRGELSPLLLRVSRRAGRSPLVSSAQRAPTNFVPFSSSDETPTTAREPSGVTVRPPRRGRAWNPSSENGSAGTGRVGSLTGCSRTSGPRPA